MTISKGQEFQTSIIYPSTSILKLTKRALVFS